MWTFVICEGCEGKGAAVGAALAAQDLPVQWAECLSVCAAPLTLAAQGQDRATYVFRDVSIDDLPDLVTFAREYEAAKNGWIIDARPLAALRFKLVTRVPAMITDPNECLPQ